MKYRGGVAENIGVHGRRVFQLGQSLVVVIPWCVCRAWGLRARDVVVWRHGRDHVSVAPLETVVSGAPKDGKVWSYGCEKEES